MSDHELISSRGCGSVVIEMAFALAGLPVCVTGSLMASPARSAIAS